MDLHVGLRSAFCADVETGICYYRVAYWGGESLNLETQPEGHRRFSICCRKVDGENVTVFFPDLLMKCTYSLSMMDDCLKKVPIEASRPNPN